MILSDTKLIRFPGSKVCQYDSNTSWFFSIVRKMPATATRVVFKKKTNKAKVRATIFSKMYIYDIGFNSIKKVQILIPCKGFVYDRIFVLKFTGFAAAVLNSRILICQSKKHKNLKKCANARERKSTLSR